MSKKRLSQTPDGNNKKSLPPYIREKPRIARDGSVKIYWSVIYKGIEKACQAGSLTDAKDVYNALVAKFAAKTPKQIGNRNRTFGELADYFEAHHLVPAVRTREGIREGGLAKPASPLHYLNGHAKKTPAQLKRCYGPDLGLRKLIGEATRLADINVPMIIKLRVTLAQHPALKMRGKCKPGEQRDASQITVCEGRSLKDINHRVNLLRRMCNIARKELGWMSNYPFAESTTSLVTSRSEVDRNRVMTCEEEKLLVDFIDGNRAHVGIIMRGLVDTCMRSTEFFQLRVRDKRRAKNGRYRFVVQQKTTKTKKERKVPLSIRFAAELEQWIEDHNLLPDDYIFNMLAIRTVCGTLPEEYDAEKLRRTHLKSLRKAWTTCLRLTGVAELQDITIKDLRRTGATRLSQRGVPISDIQHLLGHRSLEMTSRYIGYNETDLDNLADAQDQMHAEEFGTLVLPEQAEMRERIN
jgi:integrase